MPLHLTDAQKQAVLKGETVRPASPEIGEDIIVLRAALFEEIRDILDDEKEKAAWTTLARKAANHWVQDNPF